MDDKEINRLKQKAQEVCKNSYAPYSHFRVGAALLCKDGSIYVGTNIENRSYGLAICAERVAVFSALTAGKREFKAILIHGADAKHSVTPCGACRQVLSEFVDNDFIIYYPVDKNIYKTITIHELLPLDSLKELKGEKNETTDSTD